MRKAVYSVVGSPRTKVDGVVGGVAAAALFNGVAHGCGARGVLTKEEERRGEGEKRESSKSRAALLGLFSFLLLLIQQKSSLASALSSPL